MEMDILMGIHDNLRNRFSYHSPKPGQSEKYELIRSSMLAVAVMIVDKTPSGREQSLALTHLEEAVFWANAAIARNK